MVTGSTEQKLEFEVGNLYLVENHYFHTHTFQEVYVERISTVAYKFRKERSDGTWYIEWAESEDFHRKHNIIELLEVLQQPPALVDVKIEINNPDFVKELWIACPVCNGSGRVPDDSSTAGDKACPKCWGTGRTYAYSQ